VKHATVFEQLRRAYEDWDKQMLPIPLEVRRGPRENMVNRARNREPVRR
jgi:hypothetical protein